MGIGSIGNAIDQTFTVMKDAMKGATSAVRRTFEQLEVELAKIEKTASEEKKERIQLVQKTLEGINPADPDAVGKAQKLCVDNGIPIPPQLAKLSKPGESANNDDNVAAQLTQSGSIDDQVSHLFDNDSQVNWIG